jgi:hypothetical protein
MSNQKGGLIGVQTGALSLNKLAARGSVVDTRHDFPVKVIELQQPQFKASYNKGLPVGYENDDIVDEEAYLQDVVVSYQVKNQNGSWGPVKTDKYVPIVVANPRLASGHFSEHKITTVNGHTYTVKYTDVRQPGQLLLKQAITADTFCERLGIESNIAIVVDAASIGFFEILTSGLWPAGRPRPKVYYMYGPEVVNDPATKKAPDAKEFKPSQNGVQLIPCVPMSPPDFVYEYEWDPAQSPGTSYLDSFFTTYKFNLSEVKTSKKGKSQTYTTDLKITDPRTPGLTNVLIDSKTKNDINFLQAILKKILANLSTDKNKFMMSSSYQQKRGGDWLQDLLCLAFRVRARAFKVYPGGTTNIAKEFDRAFLVTHDRVALAFNLLCGNDAFYTHHQPCGLASSLHSCFSFSLDDITQIRQNTIDRANSIKGAAAQINAPLTPAALPSVPI